ncbi:uncharacterized protein LOC116742633 isoform X2 [Phocoena sinus]|uniref:uncharacterized protein LOC116742633 isoform X2 n=1 Tax=Phocoena sinus TaxID=42100 RepID=UPI0013C4478B|nr:uncharacterized protein LOC116742633 isoform X2 [Phocoena sinus]
MVPVLALFLVALVGLPVAQALDCHVCAYNGENCFNPMRCPAMVTYCMTTRTYYTPTRMKDGGVGTVCCLWGIFSWPANTDVKGTSASALCGSKHCKTTLQDLEAACLSQERLLDCVAAPPRTPGLSICLEHSCGPGADGRAEGRLDSCFSPPFVTADLWCYKSASGSFSPWELLTSLCNS